MKNEIEKEAVLFYSSCRKHRTVAHGRFCGGHLLAVALPTIMMVMTSYQSSFIKIGWIFHVERSHTVLKEMKIADTTLKSACN